MKLFFTFCLALLTTISIDAQVDVKLVELIDSEKQNCFSIEITNTGNEDVQLWGQNYRLYYNTSNVEFIEESLESNLSIAYYSEAVLKQHIYDVDASGFGVLPFESNLGFINFYIDDKTKVGGQIQLNKNKTLSIVEMCFDNKLYPGDIVWASEESTATYATAFNEMTILNLSTKKNIKKEFINYSVLIDEERIAQPTVATLNLDYYPNPFTDRLVMDFHKPTVDPVQVTVFDLFGKAVQNINLPIGSTELLIDGTNLTAGGYVINVQSKNGYSKNIKALKVDQ